MKKIRSTRRSAPKLIESLEPRRMLATFSGTGGNDTIDIFNWAGGGMAVRINGVINTTPDLSITINGGVGNDTFNVSSSRIGTTVLVRGESGNDTLINPSVEDLDAVYVADFLFDGGTGTDTVVADNIEDATTAYEMELQGYGIDKNSARLLDYDNVESLRYFDNDAGNLIGFFDLDTSADDVKVEISGSGGNDTIFNTSDVASTSGNWNESIGSGPFASVINGGDGTDKLQLRNSDSATNQYQFSEFTIFGSAFPGTGTGSISYAAFETVDFLGGSHNETVSVVSKPSGTALRVNSGGGTDTFHVGGGDLDSHGIILSTSTFIGGAGTDTINTDDAADTDATGETENYSWFATFLQKGPAGFNFSEFEVQTLKVANGFVSGFNTLPRVDLTVTANAMTSTTITGGNARMCRVDVGQGNLSNNINGTLNINLSGQALDQININNNVANTNILYRLTQSQLVAPKVVNYSGIKDLTINGGSGSETFFIDGLAAGTALTVNGNVGDDTFHVGGGNVDLNLLGPVTVNGSSGSNRTIVDNTLDTALETQTLNGANFIDGQSHTFNSLINLTINGGAGGTNLSVHSTAHQTEINGSSGNDTYIVGGGDIDANLLPTTALALQIAGGGGSDAIVLDDRNDTTLDNSTFQRTLVADQYTEKNIFITWLGIESATFDGSNAEYPGTGASANFIVVIDIASPLKINGNGGPDSIQVQDAAFPVIINTGPGEGDSIFLNADEDAIPGVAIIEQSDAVRDLGIHVGGTLRITNGAVLNKTGTIPGNLEIEGVLDLAGGAFLSSASETPMTAFQTWLTRGFNAGAWNGTHASGAINSSLAAGSSLPDAVGYGTAEEVGISTIGGFNISPGDVLVRYTFYGDADLNGVVDFDDYSRIDAGFNNNRSGWVNGDVDYNGIVDFDDYSLIDQAFLSQGAGRSSAGKG